MNYQQFLQEVQTLGCISSRDETHATVVHVMLAIAEVLPRSELAIFTALPPELMVYLDRARDEPDPHIDGHTFLGWVVSALDSTGDRDKTAGGLDLHAVYSGEEAIRRCQCVFSVIKSCLDEEQRDSLGVHLPDDVHDWYAEA